MPSPAPQTPADIAALLYRALPSPVTPATLEDYGLEATGGRARRLTREILSLCLFWAFHAVDVVLQPKEVRQVMAELRARVRAGWTSELGFAGDDPDAYFKEADERHATYGQVVREGGSPIAVATEAAGLLEHAGVVPAEERQKLLALLIDLTPVDELGDLAQQLELG